MSVTAASINVGLVGLAAGFLGSLFFPSSLTLEHAGSTLPSSAGPYHRVDKVLDALASVVERRPECVCNVVVESVGPTEISQQSQVVVAQSWNLLYAVGLASMFVGIWLGYCASSFCRRDRSEPVVGPRRVDVRAIRDARQRALALSQ